MQQTEPSKKEVYFMKIMLIANDTNFAYNLRRELMINWIEQGNEVILVAHAENYLSELEAYGFAAETGQLINIENITVIAATSKISLFFIFFILFKRVSSIYIIASVGGFVNTAQKTASFLRFVMI